MDRLSIDTLYRELDRASVGHGLSYLHSASICNGKEPAEYINRHCFRLGLRGRVQLKNGAYHASIDPESFYITNPGHPIRCITSEENALSLVVAFAPQSARNLVLVDGEELQFFECSAGAGPETLRLAQDVALLSSRVPVHDGGLQKRCEELLHSVFATQQQYIAGADQIPANSAKRRRDIFSRLLRARDHIEARYMDDPKIENLAEVAHLSRSHFLRMYRAGFGTTPHQDLLARKLRSACELLSDSKLSVTEVADASGFGNRCAFSRLFSQRYGVSPRQYRKAAHFH